MTDSTELARERLLAKLLAERGLAVPTRQAIPPREPGAVVPLTSAQRRLWFLDKLGEAGRSYLVIGSYQLTGELDVAALTEALASVVRRHEALRSYIGERAGEPVQVVDDVATPELRFHDLSAAPDRLTELVAAETDRPFRLDRAPLLRATLIRLAPARHLLMLVAHHIVCDDRSLTIVLRDLVATYRSLVDGSPGDMPALPVQFADYACWLERQDTEGRHESYWASQLAGASGVLELPTDRSRPPVATGRGRAVDCELAGDLSAGIAALARDTGCTPFMILLAAFGTVLGRLADTDDVLIGTAVTNRDAPELAEVVGMFVNTVVMRVGLAGDPTVGELLARVRTTCVDGISHGDVPLERVIELVNPDRAAGSNPLFQVMLVLNPAGAVSAPSGLRVSPAPTGTVPARFDLTLVATHGPAGISAQLDFSTDLFDGPTVSRLASMLRRVLTTMIDNRDARVWEIPLADDLTLCSGGPAIDTPLVLPLIADQARVTPDAPAVIAHDGTLTYRELVTRASRLADDLRRRGIGPESVVGLCLPAGAEAIVALLGILWAGAAYLPLDPTHPPERLASLVADAAAPLVLTTTAIQHPGAEEGPPRTMPAGHDLAYVIYTSGSTGEPKGVGVSHESLANLAVAFADRHGLGPRDRLLMVPPLSFDASVGDIFPALVSGAALVLPADPATMTGPELMRECAEHGVTAVDTASAIWQQWVSQLAEDTPAIPPSLRIMMVGGERVPVEVVRTWARLTGGRVALYNHYGPTEATVCATTYRTVDAGELSDMDVPIGRPLPGVRAYVLDRRLRPMPTGVPGELYLGGRGVARGYLGRPGLSAERFLPDPFAEVPGERMYRTGDRARHRDDGELEFLGRVDRQVKIRGNRIELGEVESALARHPEVREAVVVQAKAPARLVAYVVAGTAPGSDLRDWLGGRLPEYMIPSSVVVLDALPLTRHGKVDFAALPRPESNRPAFTAPRGAAETMVAELWAEALGVDRVGADDDFFALGGHSLLIPTIVARLRGAFGVTVPARALLDTPRLADFAATVRRHGTGTAVEPASLPTVAELHADAVLPEDIRPGTGETDEPDVVFFTGGTGVLGVRLLADILEHTDADVHCLVRASSEHAGAALLREVLARRNRWRPDYGARLVPVIGDLAAPRLGLDQRRFDELADHVGAIYHSAALINLLYPYRHLRPTNVAGTVEVLRLAARHHPTPVHFISTLGVFFGAAFARMVVTEQDEPTDPTGIGSTFATTKWVADALVRAARQRGVPATVYRLARVTGDSVTGESKIDDLFCRTIKTYVQLGCAPADGELDITPVDYLATAIGALSRKPASLNRDFHFRGSATLPQHELITAINEFGYRLETVDSAEFWRRVGRGVTERDDLGMAPFAGIRGLPSGAAAPVLDCGWTERIMAGYGLPHPAPTGELIRRYLEYFVRVGFLPTPAQPARPATTVGVADVTR